jgi:hypothetical protein
LVGSLCLVISTMSVSRWWTRLPQGRAEHPSVVTGHSLRGADVKTTVQRSGELSNCVMRCLCRFVQVSGNARPHDECGA